MGTAEKTLDWIDQAPFSFSGSAMTKASPDAVFAVLADHERWPEWFPVITKTVILGEQREGVGTRRLTNIPGGSIEERILAWDVGRRFAFTATAVHPAVVHALLDDCRIEPMQSGARVTYNVYLDPAGMVLPLLELMKGLLASELNKGMQALAARAEAL
jgi:uncharacterized protein YndB with AHSA1/START domain